MQNKGHETCRLCSCCVFLACTGEFRDRGFSLHQLSDLCSMSFPSAFYRWRPHPWHGLEVGPRPPSIVHAFIEITPFDLIKYEVDKITGYLRVDRPQRSSSLPPSLYGFVPRT